MGRIGPHAQPAVPHVGQILLKGDGLNMRIEAARTLARIGARTKVAVRVLEEAQRDQDPRIREAAEEALKRIRSESK